MVLWNLLAILKSLNYLTITRVWQLFRSIQQHGINTMLLLQMAEKSNGAHIALIDDFGTHTYKELLTGSQQLAHTLATEFQASKKTKTAFLCRNHAEFVRALFAASRTGTAIYLLNPEMRQAQFNSLLSIHRFDLLIIDEEFDHLVAHSTDQIQKVFYTGAQKISLHQEVNNQLTETIQLKRSSSSKIILLTGGTTGKLKEAAHKPSLFSFLSPFAALLSELDLRRSRTVFIASPIYYGYGIAFLFAVLALGKTAVVQQRFDAGQACALIRKHNIETVSAVPLQIEKMLNHSVSDLGTLTCIASGGAKLNARLIERVKLGLGDVLFNLYGTSEVGLNVIARPLDLHRDPRMAGKAIKGAKLKIIENGREATIGQIGQLCAKNGWSMNGKKDKWLATGDLAWKDDEGYYYLSGRVDEMVVSAGVNIYPIEIEQALTRHPLIAEAAVIGVEDEAYGQVLSAFVQPVKAASVTERMVWEWLESQVARIQIPRVVLFVDELPYTALGKPDKKQLMTGYLVDVKVCVDCDEQEEVMNTFMNALED